MKKFSNTFIASICSVCLTIGLFLTADGFSFFFWGEPTHPDMKK